MTEMNTARRSPERVLETPARARRRLSRSIWARSFIARSSILGALALCLTLLASPNVFAIAQFDEGDLEASVQQTRQMPDLTVARNTRGQSLITYFSDIENAHLFETQPTVEIVGSDTIVRGGVAAAGALGVWSAKVQLNEGGSAREVGVVRIEVVPFVAPPPPLPPSSGGGALGGCPTPTQTVTGALLRVCEVSQATQPNPAIPVWIVAANARGGTDFVDNAQVLLMNAASTAVSTDGAFTPIDLFLTPPTGELRLNAAGNYDIVLSAELTRHADGEWTAAVVLRNAGADESFGAVTLRAERNTPPAYSPLTLTVSVDEESVAGVTLDALTVASDIFPGDAAGARAMHLERDQSLTLALRDEAVSGGNVAQLGALFATTPTVRLGRSPTREDGGDGPALEAILDGGVLLAHAYGVWTATLEIIDDGLPVHTTTVGVLEVNVDQVNTEPTIQFDSGDETITTAPINDSVPNGEDVVHTFENLYLVAAQRGNGLYAGDAPETDAITLQYQYGAEESGRVRPTVLLSFGAQFANGDSRRVVSVSGTGGVQTWQDLIVITANDQARSEDVEIFASANVDRGGRALLHLRLVDEHGLISEPRALAIAVEPTNDPPALISETTSTRAVGEYEVAYTKDRVRVVVPEDSAFRGEVRLASTPHIGVNDVPPQELRVRLEERSNDLFAQAPRIALRNGAIVLDFDGARANAPVPTGQFVGVAYLSDSGIDLGSFGTAPAIEVEVATVTVEIEPANDAPTFDVATLSLTVNEDSGAVPPLVVAINLLDEEGDALAALLSGASSRVDEGTSLFATAPTAQVRPAETRDGVDLPVRIEVSGGVVADDAHGLWTATVSLSDGSSPVSVGVATIEVAPTYDAPTLVLGTMPVALVGGREMSSAGVVLARIDARDDTRTPRVRYNGGAELAQAPVAVYPFVASTPARIDVESVADGFQIVLRNGRVARGAPGETVAALELVFAPAGDLAALTLDAAITFSVSAPANAPVAVTLPANAVSVKATGAGTFVPSGVTCAPDECVLRAYYADAQACGSFDVLPRTPSEVAAQCASVRLDGDGRVELSSGQSQLWWVGASGDDFEIAARVAEYYVAPFLGFGEDLEAPVSATLSVTLAAQGRPSLTPPAPQLTITSTHNNRAHTLASNDGGLSFVWVTVMPNNVATLTLTLGSNADLFGASGAFTRGRDEIEIVALSASSDELSIGLSVTDACGAPLAAVPARDAFACASGGVIGAAELRINARAWNMPTNLSMTTYVHALSRLGVASRTFRSEQLLRAVVIPSISDNHATATVSLVGYSALAARDALIALSVSVTTSSGDAVSRQFPLGDYPIDADGDGLVDTTMHMDEDGDGVPDVDARSAAPTRLRAGEQVLVVAPGQRIELGVYSGAGGREAHAGRAGARIDRDRTVPQNLRAGPVDADGIYDFIVRLPLGERIARVVVPLESPIPRGARYWKYRRVGVPHANSDLGFWARFVVNGDDDTVFSAPRPCPALHHSEDWTPVLFDGTLTEGHECLLLVMTDGGENDDDETRNYAVVDPGAVGTRLPSADSGAGAGGNSPSTSPAPTSGSSGGDGGGGALSFVALLVLAVLALVNALKTAPSRASASLACPRHSRARLRARRLASTIGLTKRAPRRLAKSAIGEKRHETPFNEQFGTSKTPIFEDRRRREICSLLKKRTNNNGVWYNERNYVDNLTRG